MQFPVLVRYKNEDVNLGNVDVLTFKDDIPDLKEYLISLMQRGADLDRDNRCSVDSLIEDLFKECDVKLVDRYVKDNYSLITEHFEWERLGWIAEFIDISDSLEGKLPEGFYIIYGSVRGILPRDFPSNLKYSAILYKTWNLLRNEIRDGIIISWLDNNWEEAQQYLSKMRFPPTFEQDYYIGATHRELFKVYAKRLSKNSGKRCEEIEGENKQNA
jgi:hypothetical protein